MCRSFRHITLCRTCLAEQHLARVFNKLLDLHEEGDSFPAVEETVVIGEGEVHHLDSISKCHTAHSYRATHRSDNNLPVDNNRLVLDRMETKNSSLRQVDDRGSH